MSADEAPETEAEEAEPAGESDGMSERAARVILALVAGLAVWGLVAAFPEIAYVIVGILGTHGWQKARHWTTRRHDDQAAAEEETPPDVGEALRRLVGDDKGVLLTTLRADLKLPDTKAVKALLKAEGIPWKAVRTGEGNGPAVHRDAIPPAPSPPAAEPHGEGCCCRSDDNANSNNGDGEASGEGIRVQAIGDAGYLAPTRGDLENIVDRFFAEAEKAHGKTHRREPPTP
ncbi:hypothetical protein SAMN04487981_101619 [Streptomyces sp. cf386]|uniref:hypothetical protein n=1 Tax=Streptomyces sp. cf386 TaxID=1761904 RepID=UPI00088DBC6A|nr:hypothetical protein [Streptomyces sp. cf386]SDM46842.1 hypothetical protein SAMN04487981_101619 [Streptomyces sp. cf386]